MLRLIEQGLQRALLKRNESDFRRVDIATSPRHAPPPQHRHKLYDPYMIQVPSVQDLQNSDDLSQNILKQRSVKFSPALVAASVQAELIMRRSVSISLQVRFLETIISSYTVYKNGVFLFRLK